MQWHEEKGTCASQLISRQENELVKNLTVPAILLPIFMILVCLDFLFVCERGKREKNEDKVAVKSIHMLYKYLYIQ